MRILLIEEERHVADFLRKQAGKLDVSFDHSVSLEEGLRLANKNDTDVVMMRDIISGQPSCFAIEDFKNTSLLPEILIYSDKGDSRHAEHALEGGAWDYVVDEDLEQRLPEMLRRVVRYRSNKQKGEVRRRQDVRDQLNVHGILGSSAAMQKCLDLVAKVGHTEASVLITGETGTGKELFANAIHDISPRGHKKLTIIDCAALPSTLVESILFGHTKGSFTGADKTQKGLVKQADGGTLFLDEIGEMPLEIQKKFLRVLQEQKYLPVGSNVTERSNFRLIAATNRNLEDMVARREFREDLLFRLKTFHIELPPLRTRKTDIPQLVYHFRNIYIRKHKLKKKKISTNYLVILNQYEWPGNVRELFQAVEYSLTNAYESNILESNHLPVNIRLAVTKAKLKKNNMPGIVQYTSSLPNELSAMPTMKEDRDRTIMEQEKHYLQRLLVLNNGDINRCCKMASLSRSRLYDLLKKYSLTHKISKRPNLKN